MCSLPRPSTAAGQGFTSQYYQGGEGASRNMSYTQVSMSLSQTESSFNAIKGAVLSAGLLALKGPRLGLTAWGANHSASLRKSRRTPQQSLVLPCLSRFHTRPNGPLQDGTTPTQTSQPQHQHQWSNSSHQLSHSFSQYLFQSDLPFR